MSYMSVLQCRMSDVGRWAEIWNDWGRNFGLSTGATRATISQTIMGGDQAGLVTISFMWDSIDAALSGVTAMNEESRVREAFAEAGVQPVQRSLLQIEQEHGEGEGSFYTALVLTGDAPTPEDQAADFDRNFAILSKHGVNGMRLMRSIAGGAMTGAWLNVTYTDSVDTLMAGSREVFADPEMQASMAKSNLQLQSRSISRML
jgi:hypothetical protein